MTKPSDNSDPKIQGMLKLKLFFKKLFTKRSPALNGVNNVDDVVVDSDIKSAAEDKFTNNISGFVQKTVDDVMIPRPNIISVNLNSSLEELNKIIVKHSHTRIIVYKNNLDNISGFIHIKDLFQVIANSKKFNLKKLLRKHIVTTHSMKLVDLLSQMQSTRTHIAIVVDEYGGTDGLITSQDIIEEIVGEIDDEHDSNEEPTYKLLKPGLLVANARVEIETLQKIIKLKLKGGGDNFDTIGGLIMAKLSTVPQKGEVIDIGNGIVAEILDSTPRTIKKIKITYPAK